MEVWKKIEGFSGYYISNIGRVRSIKRGKEKILKAKINKYGYYEVALQTDDYKQKMKRVNRLVAEAFIPNPSNLSEVNHKDENKLNNNVDNLEWLSHGDNSRYSKSMRVAQVDGERVIKVYDSITKASIETGRSISYIRNVCYNLINPSGISWRFI